MDDTLRSNALILSWLVKAEQPVPRVDDAQPLHMMPLLLHQAPSWLSAKRGDRQWPLVDAALQLRGTGGGGGANLPGKLLHDVCLPHARRLPVSGSSPAVYLIMCCEWLVPEAPRHKCSDGILHVGKSCFNGTHGRPDGLHFQVKLTIKCPAQSKPAWRSLACLRNCLWCNNEREGLWRLKSPARVKAPGIET